LKFRCELSGLPNRFGKGQAADGLRTWELAAGREECPIVGLQQVNPGGDALQTHALALSRLSHERWWRPGASTPRTARELHHHHPVNAGGAGKIAAGRDAPREIGALLQALAGSLPLLNFGFEQLLDIQDRLMKLVPNGNATEAPPNDPLSDAINAFAQAAKDFA
jgi:hypothetical protein